MPVYVVSVCNTHVISSEPHGVMVSTHGSGFSHVQIGVSSLGGQSVGLGSMV